MQRLIDADALIPMMKYATTDSEIGVFPIKIGFNAITEVINNAPTIDAVPVIRCKACRWFRNDDEGTWCVAWAGQNTNPDAFCSYAQPKERGR